MEGPQKKPKWGGRRVGRKNNPPKLRKNFGGEKTPGGQGGPHKGRKKTLCGKKINHPHQGGREQRGGKLPQNTAGKKPPGGNTTTEKILPC